jgi:hypothetical protein
MNHESNGNLIDRYGESMNSSEVINARELKFCEGCGVLLVRLRGSKVQFCPHCEQSMAIATGRMQISRISTTAQGWFSEILQLEPLRSSSSANSAKKEWSHGVTLPQ